MPFQVVKLMGILEAFQIDDVFFKVLKDY